MGAGSRYIIPLAQVDQSHEPLVGAKAARLAILSKTGHPVAPGFCVAVGAYECFLAESRLETLIRMELDRKRFEDMRWEELWDAALRIRAAFNAHPVPAAVAAAVDEALAGYPADLAWAVRSSAPGEDAAHRSFAGLHESYVGVVGRAAVLDALRLVWASLWSDAAMLYRREVGLDPAHSRMAVLVQAMRTAPVSGVAFGCDPRQLSREIAIIEAVPGVCAGLVDGEIDPDRWQLRRADGTVVAWQPGQREPAGTPGPLLDGADISHLLRVISSVEEQFRWPPDIEWTGRAAEFTLLQARPVTTAAPAGDDKREWYLTLRPGLARLRKLRTRVADELIPALAAEGARLAAANLDAHTEAQLADAIAERRDALQRWTKIYWDEFIPFAHGVRRLAVYYNDAVRPRDPYEFVGLLQGEDLLASQRNAALHAIADQVRQQPPLAATLDQAGHWLPAEPERWADTVRAVTGGEVFLAAFRRVMENALDLAYDTARLADRPDLILRSVLELARATTRPHGAATESPSTTVATLEQRLLAAVGPARQEEARETLATARLSWRLRDNDNLLLSRIESQLIRAIEIAARRLKAAGRLAANAPVSAKVAELVIAALRDRSGAVLVLPVEQPAAATVAVAGTRAETPRQLTGQPAAAGLATGKVRCVRRTEDLGRFQAGEVLVCDAIQPMMTHLVPLACAVVERRGGMLIHGAIIARELGIPCVNGVPDVVELLPDGQVVTVDGYLGIVTVGPPDFDLELAARQQPRARRADHLP
ncbi:MAG: hypothetical protein FJ395_01120 [Verrucomicrobia bacterium]|nr:hypothetical protein [Verrucomicrobiota bacterium]